MYRHDLSEGFPLLTTKKLHIKSILHELLWFLKGSTTSGILKRMGVSIWDDWANSEESWARFTVLSGAHGKALTEKFIDQVRL